MQLNLYAIHVAVVLNVADMLRQRRVISVSVVDQRTLPHTFAVAMCLMWKLLTQSPQVTTTSY